MGRSENTLVIPGAICAFWVPFNGLRSKSNFRRSGGSKEWSTLSAFADSFAWTLRTHRPSGWVLGSKELAVGNRPSVVVAIDAQTTLDCGNVDKTILDAAEGILYWSDSQVRAELVTTERKRSSTGFSAFAILDGSLAAKAVVWDLSMAAAAAALVLDNHKS